MSDGQSKSASHGPPALDDIILGDDDHTLPTPPVVARGSVAAPPTMKDADVLAKTVESGGGRGEERTSTLPRERTSDRVKAADPIGKDARKRQKMTLRIPDDEVSRPQLSASTPIAGVPMVRAASRPPSSPEYESPTPMPLTPQRIINIGSADDTLELPRIDAEGRGIGLAAAGIDAAQEAGWTPYQPMVADRGADLGGDRIVARGGDGAAAAAQAALFRDPARTMIDEPGMGAMASMMLGQESSPPPVSEDIPIDTDDDSVERDRYDEPPTVPRLPVSLDDGDGRLDDGDRHTDPGEVPDEIGADDLVSVESIPQPPHAAHAPPLLKVTAKQATPTPAVVTASSLMASASPPAGAHGAPAPLVMSPLVSATLAGGASQGAAPVAAKAPSMPAPPLPSTPPAASAPQAPHAPQGPHEPPPQPPGDGTHDPSAYTAPAAGTPMARRQQPEGGPFGFMGAHATAGALAPPAMNETAAHRKKTRPWWEDLFNDDFIRTMAKIADADIARETNFIEESLGCEAGATILDLACGTGRHAVELASRGYQVVGFDLSLAMLARASDEAQERKQKINFVQGDMREMTFEETFDGVFSWNTSFGFFDEEKNAAVIAKVHRALKKGGQFLLDVVNRDCLVRTAPSLAWFEGDGCICMDEMQVDFITSRMKVKRTLMMDDGRTKEIEYSIRVYSLHELGKMLHDNGFRVAEVSGRTGTPGVFFGCESPRTLILAEKR